MCKAYHAGRAIGWIEQHIHNIQAARVGQSDSESVLELSVSGDLRADSTSDHVANSFIAPLVDIVERAFEDLPFSGVASIIQHHDYRRLAVSYGGRKFRSCHLKRAVTDQHNRSKRRIGK